MLFPDSGFKIAETGPPLQVNLPPNLHIFEIELPCRNYLFSKSIEIVYIRPLKALHMLRYMQFKICAYSSSFNVEIFMYYIHKLVFYDLSYVYILIKLYYSLIVLCR